VRWLDAPGPDADLGSEDDCQAFEAVWLKADIRLFVLTQADHLADRLHDAPIQPKIDLFELKDQIRKPAI
jgi:hypothetical protein